VFDHRTNLSALWSHLSATASVAHQKSKTEFLLSSEMATQDESSTSRLEWQRRHEQALRTTAESLQVGRATAQTLSVQAEQLGRSERVLDETQATVALSKRVLRGMTWSGWLTNKLSSAPSLSANQGATEVCTLQVSANG